MSLLLLLLLLGVLMQTSVLHMLLVMMLVVRMLQRHSLIVWLGEIALLCLLLLLVTASRDMVRRPGQRVGGAATAAVWRAGCRVRVRDDPAVAVVVVVAAGAEVPAGVVCVVGVRWGRRRVLVVVGVSVLLLLLAVVTRVGVLKLDGRLDRRVDGHGRRSHRHHQSSRDLCRLRVGRRVVTPLATTTAADAVGRG